jgi:hypothetical protein
MPDSTSLRFCLAVCAQLFAVGCDSTDVGKPCPGMDVPNTGTSTTQGDVVIAQGAQIVEYSAAFPCDSGICVATIGANPPGYCSALCTSDKDFPRAMGCAPVMTQGPFANNTYCVWRRCQTDADCGDPWTIDCKPIIPYSPYMVCTFRS